MSFDKTTRNRLAKFVADARRVIADEFTEQFQSLYGISAKGDIAPLDKLGHLDESGLATAALLRERIGYLEKTHPDDKDGTKAAVARLAREQAFTILNRLAAIRMAEKRGLIVESVGQGYQSKGFKVFETVAGSALGDTYHRYRRYLFCLFDELAIDLGILFDRRSPQALLFPREAALLTLLDHLHASDLERLWAEDETIGWIYQYYNDPEERKKMRKESAAPRNSRELAVRNQFFTPRYVVEFLTDNTLGRIWYEMTRGQTRLAEQCRYLVRRPTEIFLAEGETAPETPDQEGLSQEELLKQPVHIPHRQLKDPREIRLLDPACGSMHFGLYAFDLFETIYEETWDNGSCPALHEAYASKDEFLKDVPRLIIEHNIHGIDIDPRAAQIAGLSLWLRAQKAWQQLKVPAADRPRVRRSNIVCAEPMPGSPEMLEAFVATLKPELLGELVKTVFDKMQLAGEAGSLLKIEEEIRTAIDTARKEWLKQQDDLLTRKDGGQEEFFDTAEQQVIDALRAYAEQADADSYQRRLFADDAARGFAFIDLCRKRYDAVVMNPPFGEAAEKTTDLIEVAYPFHANNLLCSFLQRAKQISPSGRIGTVLDRTALIKNSYEDFRRGCLLDDKSLDLVLDLGWGVLDANVEVSAFVTSENKVTEVRGWNLTQSEDKALELSADILGGEALEHRAISRFPFAAVNLQMPVFFRHAVANCLTLSEAGCTFYNGHTIKSDVFKRLAWEVCPSRLQSQLTSRMWNGSGYSPFRVAFQECTHISDYAGDLKNHSSTIFRSPDKHGLSGLCFGKRGNYLDVQIQPPGFVLTNEGFGGGITSHSKAYAFLAFLNSRTAQYSINLYCGQHKGVGYVNTLPFPAKTEQHFDALARVAEQGYEITQSIQCLSETDHEFCIPFSGASDAESLVNGTRQKLSNAYRQLKARIDEGDELIATLMGLTEIERDLVAKETASRAIACPFEGQTLDELETYSTPLTTSIVSYFLGTAFGRWDIRFATGERQPPELPDPFDPLPACPPGMLQNAEGLPAEPKDVPADYPLRVSWPGILVDDENHPEDIVARVREAIEVIWKDRAEAIEQEACGILGVKSLRDYFRRPAAFFADHLKRYSKSRRQAPIYWPLSTKSGSYTLWLYYHRLTDQTLHTCLADFLDPKLRKVQSELDALTASGGGDTRAGELGEFLDELKDLRDEIERVIKLPWKPNLNDGVLITASPLHKLFRLPKWQKDLKACWEKLAKGDYDWAHLAYTIWPSRVEKACEKDRSIAIAHGLEHLCKIEPTKTKKKRAKKAEEEEPDEDEPQLIEEG
jgi:hypothetical protein